MSGTYLELCVPQVLLITVARQSEKVNGSISMMQDSAYACDDVSLRSQVRIQVSRCCAIAECAPDPLVK